MSEALWDEEGNRIAIYNCLGNLHRVYGVTCVSQNRKFVYGFNTSYSTAYLPRQGGWTPLTKKKILENWDYITHGSVLPDLLSCDNIDHEIKKKLKLWIKI